MEKQTLLILGGGIMQVPAVRIARERGLRVAVFDRSSQVPGADLADVFLPVDISDEEACTQAAQELSLKEDLRGAMTLGTDFSTTVARITQALRLPGHSYEAALQAKDKFLMRRCFKEAGVPSPEFLRIEVPEDSRKVDFPGPWVVKPVDSMGARGVQLVRQIRDLEAAAAEALLYSRKKAALVEEFIPGREFSLDALVSGGAISVQGLADRDIRFPPRFIEMGHRFPSLASEEEKILLCDTFKKGIRSLGLSQGAAKGDLRWHPEKGPMVGEIAARLSGGYMSGWTYPYSSGLSSIAQAVSLALGETGELRGSLGPEPVAERAVISMPGVISRMDGTEELKKLPGFRNLFLSRNPGEEVIFPRNNVEKVGNFILAAGSAADLDGQIKSAYSHIVVRLEPRNPKTEEWLEASEAFPAFSKDSQLDYYGFTRQEVLERFRVMTGADGTSLGNKDGKFWTYLERGSLQGLLYYWDSFGAGD